MSIQQIIGSLDSKKNLRFNQIPQVNQGENLTTEIRIGVPDEFLSCDFYLEFFCPKNKKFIVGPLQPSSTESGSSIGYAMQNCVLASPGVVYVQLCARSGEDGKTVFKSVRNSNASFYVNESIDADGEPYISDDMLGKLLDSFAELEKTAAAAASDGETARLAGEYAEQIAESLLADKEAGLFKGEKGDTGPEGPRGERGLQGPQGDKGEKGDTGDKGDKGDPLEVKKWYASVSEMQADYNGSDVGLNELVGVQGGNGENGNLYAKTSEGWVFVSSFEGAKGDKGDTGATPNMTLKVEMQETGSSAFVSKSGTTENPVFLLGIPKGDRGAKGADGAPGPQGPQGEKGEKGDKGDDGMPGGPGVTPDITFVATLLPAGSAPTATKSGTNANPLVTIGIPQGEKGDKGDTGERGLQGVQGNKGDKGEVGETPSVSAEVVSIGFNETASVVRSGTDLNPKFTFRLPKGEPASMTYGDPIPGYRHGYVLMCDHGYLGEMQAAEYETVEKITTMLADMFVFDETSATLTVTLDTELL